MAPLRRVKPGDVVKVAIRGRVFFAVAGKSSDGRVAITPIDPRIGYFSATSRQVTEVYRRLRL